MAHPPLLVQRRDRLGARGLAARRPHRAERYTGIDHAQGGLDHLAAVVDLGDNPVGGVGSIGRDRGARPFGRSVAARDVGQHVAVPAGIGAGDDDPGLVGLFA